MPYSSYQIYQALKRTPFRQRDDSVDSTHSGPSVSVTPISAEKRAAMMISRVYRNYLGRKQSARGAIALKDLSILLSIMRQLNALITYSDTAASANNMFQYSRHGKSYINRAVAGNVAKAFDSQPVITQNQQQYIRQALMAAIDSRSACCDELAQLAYVMIKSHPTLPQAIKDTAFCCKLSKTHGEDDDHVFLVFGDPSHEDAVVFDPWLKYRNFMVVRHYRQQDSFADQRDRGYLGSQDEYLKFLAAHHDGYYVRSLQTPAERKIIKLETQPDNLTVTIVNNYLRLPVNILSDGSCYRGQVDFSGVPHGCGRLVHQDGSIIEGFWQNGRIHSQALKRYHEQGDIIYYQGELSVDYRASGLGVKMSIPHDYQKRTGDCRQFHWGYWALDAIKYYQDGQCIARYLGKCGNPRLAMFQHLITLSATDKLKLPVPRSSGVLSSNPS